MGGISGDGGYASPYKQDIETYQKIKKYDRRGQLFHNNSLLPKYQHHDDITSSGSSLEETLRNLEKKAHLPKGDLYITNLENPGKTYSLITGEMKEYYLSSKKAENEWIEDINKYLKSKGKLTLGYIAGSIYETNDKEHLDDLRQKVADRLSESNTSIIEALVMVKMANPPKFIGSLFISENCPGMFFYDNEKRKSRCVYCGEDEKGLKY